MAILNSSKDKDIIISIYELRDPRDLECKPRYVGITSKSLKTRLNGHLKDTEAFTHKINWIKSLIKIGILPSIHLIEEAYSWHKAFLLEKYWIKEFKDIGYKLTNGTLGGEGLEGVQFSKEVKEKISKSAKGRIVSESTRIKLGNKSRGRIMSSNTKSALQKANIGRKMSEEAKNKIRNYRTGTKASTATKNKISKSLKGNTRSKGKLKKLLYIVDSSENRFNFNSVEECIIFLKNNYGITRYEFYFILKPYKRFLEKNIISINIFHENNIKGKEILCVEDNLNFKSISECAKFYHTSNWKIKKACLKGEVLNNKHYEFLNKELYE